MQNLVRPAVLLLIAATMAIAQSNRGAITGAVTDPSNANVPGAKMLLRNAETGVEAETETNEAGNYTLSSLPVGTYDLTVQAAGFKTVVQKQLIVQLAQTLRVDVKLDVGASTESISVSATADMLKTENAEQSTNVSGAKLNELPINFGGASTGGGIRNWLTFTYLAPGVAGTSATASVNGLPGGNYKVYLEGQDSTSPVAVGWTSTVQAASVESITEFAVQSSNYSAEYGQVLGGLYNFTTKSGTNQFHGSAYENFVNEAFNAAQPFNHVKNKDRQHDYGFSIGGPIRIPKVYDGRNRTFFFFNLERYRNHLVSQAQNGTLPTQAYRQGDFSCALHVYQTDCTGATVTLTDPSSGYTFLQNQIFDPATTYTDAQGRLMRNAFPNNTIPLSRMDPVALKIQALLPQPIGTQTTNNWAPRYVTNTRQDIPSIKIDQNFGYATKVSFYFNRSTTNTPAYDDGLPLPLSGIRKTEGALVGGNQYRLNIDRTITPSMLAHLGLGYWRFENPDSSPASVLDYDVQKNLGLVGSSTGRGFPRISGYGYTTLGMQTSTFQQTGIGSAVGSLMWTRGRHNYKAGFEVKDSVYSSQSNDNVTGQYNFSAAQSAIPFLNSTTVGTGSLTGGIGMGYASFLLGQVQNYAVGPPKAAQQRSLQTGIYVQDSFKATPRLTLEIGLRWDRTPPGHEAWDRQSQINLTIPNANAGGLLGATSFAGYGPGRCNCEFLQTYNYAIAPRLAAAYKLNDKTVIRAGWGISYGAVDQWNYLSNNYLINGMGYSTISPGNNPQFGYAYSQLKDGIVYNPSDLYKVNLDPTINSPKGAIGNPSASAIMYDPTGARPPRVNNWNVSLQRQLTKDMTLEASYVANRGVWLQMNGLAKMNAITPARYRALGVDLTNAATRSILTQGICSTAAVNAGYKLPYSSFPCSATVAQSLRPYPHFGDLNPTFVNQGNSYYDSLQVKFLKRLSHGLDVSANYTFSKTLNVGGYINADPSNRVIQKGLDSNHYPHMLVSAVTYRTPKATGNKLLRELTGNWTYSAALRYASGAMIAAPQSQISRYSSYTFASGTPMLRVPGVPLYLTDINCRCIDPNNINQRILNPAAWQDVPAGTISAGSGYYSDYRGPHQVSENMSLGRSFQLHEKVTLNVRAEFFNVFNRVTLGTPNSSNPTQVTSVNSATGAINGFGYYNYGSTSNAGGQRMGLMVARIIF